MTPAMKILHVVAGNRWTGAVAPAFGEVAALREAGVDAHFAYVGGYKLEAKIGRLDFTHSIIAKAQNPFSFLGSARALDRLVGHHGFDVVHAHLTYDHWLARTVAADRNVLLARTFHSRRVLRSDPFTRSLIARSALICVTSDALRDAAPIRNREPLFTPPPVNRQEFTPDGPDARERYGLSPDAKVISAIGKLSKDRGFELVLQTFAQIRGERQDVYLMIIGHGDHRPALEQLVRELGVGLAVIWAGYHEDDLARHYRTADIHLFAAKGSEEGHRAVLEAMACGAVPVTVPLDGIPSLLGDFSPRLIAGEASPGSLAERVGALLREDLAPLRRLLLQRSDQFAFPRAADRLMRAYAEIL
jgi:glycosyltransferase involved in cell wall biosynthesis